MGELVRPEFGVLQAEGDYIRIRASLCLLCSENEMENGALHWRACVFMCVNVCVRVCLHECGWWEHNCSYTFA